MTKETNTWMRSFRCNSTLWDRAKAKAQGNGRTLGSVLRELLTDYVSGGTK